MSAQRSAHRRHALAQRGLLDGSPSTTSSDFWDWLFPHDSTTSSSTSTTSTSASTGLTDLPPPTTLGSDPFSTSEQPQHTDTTSSSTTPLPTPTPPPTSTHKSTVVVTVSQAATNVNAAATNTPSGASKAGAIVGGIGATLLGIAVICALVAFVLRRLRKRRQDADAFDAASFRRSAVLMPDPPTHEDTVSAGFNSPRPPPLMTELRPPMYGMYGQGQPSPYGNQNSYFPSPSSANPFIPHQPYTQSPFSPADAPADSFHDLPPPVLTRNSVGAASNISGISVDQGPVATHYVELNRSPSFARALYVEVPKKRQSEQSAAADHAQDSPPPVPQKDTPAGIRASITSQSEDLTHGLNFPAPPSPALTSASKYGVPSTPPVLPEISVRDSGYEFPSPAIISQFPSGVTEMASEQAVTLKTPTAPTFPITPSPLASSFTLSPAANQKDFATIPNAEPVSFAVPPAAAQPAPRQRPETVYDMDDVYGGI